jgi:ribonucleotide reductase beta subunit family protein with ferritin-like domain
MDLTLRPMRYPRFYDRFRDAIKNTWTVEEVDLHSDLKDLDRLSASERHLVSRLVAFFATGDTIVANNLVLNLYQHVNSPEGRLYLSRQLFEEAACRYPTCASTCSTWPTGGSRSWTSSRSTGRRTRAFMELQDVQELSNFFERRVSAYQVGVTGGVRFDDDF